MPVSTSISSPKGETVIFPPSPLSFLFWNLNQPREDILASLAKQHHVDVLMLAECPTIPGKILMALNHASAQYFFVPSKCPRIMIFTRFPEYHLQPEAEGRHYAIRRLILPNRVTILLCVVHFPSKLRSGSAEQTAFASEFSKQILAPAEQHVGHSRTILVGDLNMNPYEDGVVQYNGLHAVSTRRIAQKQYRKVNTLESNRFFYNPMWQHFGERPEGHAGTYYYASPKARADYWNIFDQILVRPDLLPYFRDEDVRILHHDEKLNLSLLRQGKPDQPTVSDHLPILCRLHL
jgi:exonuclease III